MLVNLLITEYGWEVGLTPSQSETVVTCDLAGPPCDSGILLQISSVHVYLCKTNEKKIYFHFF